MSMLSEVESCSFKKQCCSRCIAAEYSLPPYVVVTTMYASSWSCFPLSAAPKEKLPSPSPPQLHLRHASTACTA
ncbi:hypothetical protein MRB53_037561 [Persea americana]|nr:hypothetical protein MRB53_037561 [Persea americana]